jgi:hypothetical protein
MKAEYNWLQDLQCTYTENCSVFQPVNDDMLKFETCYHHNPRFLTWNVQHGIGTISASLEWVEM